MLLVLWMREDAANGAVSYNSRSAPREREDSATVLFDDGPRDLLLIDIFWMTACCAFLRVKLMGSYSGLGIPAVQRNRMLLAVAHAFGIRDNARGAAPESPRTRSHAEHLRDTREVQKWCGVAARRRRRAPKLIACHFQDVDPLQDYPAPRHAVESDDSEDESFMPAVAALNPSPTITVQFPKPPLLPASTSLVVLIGGAGQEWLQYISPAPTLQAICCNGAEVGLLISDSTGNPELYAAGGDNRL